MSQIRAPWQMRRNFTTHLLNHFGNSHLHNCLRLRKQILRWWLHLQFSNLFERHSPFFYVQNANKKLRSSTLLLFFIISKLWCPTTRSLYETANELFVWHGCGWSICSPYIMNWVNEYRESRIAECPPNLKTNIRSFWRSSLFRKNIHFYLHQNSNWISCEPLCGFIEQVRWSRKKNYARDINFMRNTSCPIRSPYLLFKKLENKPLITVWLKCES